MFIGFNQFSENKNMRLRFCHPRVTRAGYPTASKLIRRCSLGSVSRNAF
jgi:hypothetical protein